MPKVVIPKQAKLSIPMRLSGAAPVKLNPVSRSVLKTRTAAAAPPPAAADPWAPIIALARSSIQTPQQILALSRSRAATDETAALAAQKAQTDAEIARINAQGTRAQGFAQALAKLSSGQDDQAMANYTTAAQTLQGLGTGLTGAVAEGYQSGADRAAEVVRNLTGGLGQVNAPAAADIRNASQYAGVTSPALTLAASAPNAAALARAEAAQRVAGISQIGQGYDAQATQAIEQAAADRRALIAKRPSTIQDLVQQLTENRSAGVTNLANMIGARTTYQQQQITNQQAADKAQRDQSNDLFNRWLQTQQLQTTQGYLTASQNRDYMTATGMIPGSDAPTFAAQQQGFENTSKRSGLAAQWTSYNHFKTDWQGQPILDAKGQKQPVGGYKLGPDGQSVVAAKTPKTGAALTGGLTPSGYGKLVETAQTDAGNWAKGVPPDYQLVSPQYDDNGVLRPGTGIQVKVKGTGEDPLGYSDVLGRLQSRNPSRRWQKQALDIVNSIYLPKLQAAIEMGFGNKVPYNTALGTLITAGYPADLAMKGLEPVYGIGPFPNAGTVFGKAPKAAAKPGAAAAMAKGKTWDPKVDPLRSFVGSSGIFTTESGRQVGPDHKYL